MTTKTSPTITTPEAARRKARSARRALAVEAAYLRELSSRAPVTNRAAHAFSS